MEFSPLVSLFILFPNWFRFYQLEPCQAALSPFDILFDIYCCHHCLSDFSTFWHNKDSQSSSCTSLALVLESALAPSAGDWLIGTKVWMLIAGCFSLLHIFSVDRGRKGVLWGGGDFIYIYISMYALKCEFTWEWWWFHGYVHRWKLLKLNLHRAASKTWVLLMSPILMSHHVSRSRLPLSRWATLPNTGSHYNGEIDPFAEAWDTQKAGSGWMS